MKGRGFVVYYSGIVGWDQMSCFCALCVCACGGGDGVGGWGGGMFSFYCIILGFVVKQTVMLTRNIAMHTVCISADRRYANLKQLNQSILSLTRVCAHNT